MNLGLTLRSNSANIQPTAHMSTPTPYILAPNSNSGARYHLGKNGIISYENPTTKANVFFGQGLTKKL